MYAWHPAKKKIVFWYLDPTGYYEGEIKIEGPRVDHIFTGYGADGKPQSWRFWLENSGEGRMPAKIFEGHNGEWKEVVSLLYLKSAK